MPEQQAVGETLDHADLKDQSLSLYLRQLLLKWMRKPAKQTMSPPDRWG